MTDSLRSINASLQEEIDALYRSVAIEMKLMASDHLEPLTYRANNGGSYRQQIQPLITDLQGIQRRLLAIQAFERVLSSLSQEIPPDP